MYERCHANMTYLELVLLTLRAGSIMSLLITC